MARAAAEQGRAGKAPRDLRADLFRGIALWFIFINHVPGNWLGYVTLRNYALCDATEVFVLLAGYAAGIAYGRVMEREGWIFAGAQVVRRVGTLYVAHIVLFVMFTAQVGYSAAALQDSIYIDELHLDAFGVEPYRALLEALLLRFQPAFLNILPLYIVLLLLLAVTLPLIRRPWLLLGVSFGLYVATRGFGWELPSWSGGGWFFNPPAWQLLFCIGLLLGYRAPGAARPWLVVPWWRGVGVLAAVWLALVAWIMLTTAFRPDWAARMPDWLRGVFDEVDKSSLHPFRLLSVLALTYLVAHAVPQGAAWLRGRVARPFVLMGMRGLSVFCAGILFSFMGRLALEISDEGGMQVAVNVLGLGCLVAVAWLSAWYKRRERAPQAAGPVAARVATIGAMAMLIGLGMGGGAARASVCEAPVEYFQAGARMPVVAKAIREGDLRVLVVGSASVLGPGGSGPEAAWPQRFAQALREAKPGLRVALEVRGSRGVMAEEMLGYIQGAVAPMPHLVVWQAGTVEAARALEPEWLARRLSAGLDLLRERGVDALLVDQQFSRFMRANADIEPYRDVLRMAGTANGVAVFPRYALMQHWAEAERLDLERTPRAGRVAAVDQLGACIGGGLARLVLNGAAEAGR